jgi:hypothetical protein
MQGVAVGALVAGQVEVWRPVALAAGRRLRQGPVPRGAVVPGDPRLLRRALANLVANALEHGQGDVTVSARRRGDRVRLEVQDGASAAGQPGPEPAGRRGPEPAGRRGPGPAGRRGPGAAPAAGPRPVVVRPASPLADILRGGGSRRGHGLGIAAAAAAAHGGRLLLARDAAGTVAILELPALGASARTPRAGRSVARRARPAPPASPPGGAASRPAAASAAAEGGD